MQVEIETTGRHTYGDSIATEHAITFVRGLDMSLLSELHLILFLVLVSQAVLLVVSLLTLFKGVKRD